MNLGERLKQMREAYVCPNCGEIMALLPAAETYHCPYCDLEVPLLLACQRPDLFP